MTNTAATELRRMDYLQAMGIQTYVSRKQLPGAGATQRLALVLGPATADSANSPEPVAPKSKSRPQLPTIDGLEKRTITAAQVTTQVTNSTTAAPPPMAVDRFSLAIIIAGGVLWLEELSGPLLARDQVQLVQAMSRALLSHGIGSAPASGSGNAADVSQFDWPIHTNAQLDLGHEAACASVTGFVRRKLEQHGCLSSVVLGENCLQRFVMSDLGIEYRVTSATSAGMLLQPQLKKQVWQELLAAPVAG